MRRTRLLEVYSNLHGTQEDLGNFINFLALALHDDSTLQAVRSLQSKGINVSCGPSGSADASLQPSKSERGTSAPTIPQARDKSTTTKHREFRDKKRWDKIGKTLVNRSNSDSTKVLSSRDIRNDFANAGLNATQMDTGKSGKNKSGSSCASVPKDSKTKFKVCTGCGCLGH